MLWHLRKTLLWQESVEVMRAVGTIQRPGQTSCGGCRAVKRYPAMRKGLGSMPKALAQPVRPISLSAAPAAASPDSTAFWRPQHHGISGSCDSAPCVRIVFAVAPSRGAKRRVWRGALSHRMSRRTAPWHKAQPPSKKRMGPVRLAVRSLLHRNCPLNHCHSLRCLCPVVRVRACRKTKSHWHK